MNVDRTKLSVDELAKLEQYEFNLKQVKRLKDIQDIMTEIAGVLSDSEEETKSSVKQFGALLTDIRETLKSLDKKEAPEAPEMPDYAKPVVSELKQLEKALTASIKGIQVSPQVNVEAPDVIVPKVDLSGVEKVLKTLPDAFDKAIKSIPKPEQNDYSEQFAEMLDQLRSIDTASRLKPQFPNTLKVTNPDGSTITSDPANNYSLVQFDDTSSASYEYYAYMNSSSSWYIKRLTTATSLFEFTAPVATSYSTGWTNRASLTYIEKGGAF